MSEISKRQIQFIQALRRRKGIDDETYAAMKSDVGVSSTRDLTNAQFDQLLARIEGRAVPSSGFRGRKGYKPVHRSAKRSGMHIPPPAETAAMISKVEAILAELQLPWSYVDGMAKHMFGVDRFRWCNSAQVYKVLQALIIHQKRLS
ncbi:MAG: regulatory protein GemA [Syntrophobacter sp.]